MLKRNLKGAVGCYQRVTDRRRLVGGHLGPHQRPLQRVHGVQDGRDDVLVADGGVDHHVIQAASGPVGAEIMFYEGDAIPVHRIQQLFRFFFALAYQPQAPKLLCPWGVEEDMESIRVLPQEIRRATTHDHAVAGRSGLFHHLLAHSHQAIGIEDFQAGRHASLVAAPPEYFGQTVKSAVHTFFAALDCGAVHLGQFGDFLRQGVVPQFPAEAAGKLAGNFARAASEFAFDGDHPVHDLSPSARRFRRRWAVVSSGTPAESSPGLQLPATRSYQCTPACWPDGRESLAPVHRPCAWRPRVKILWPRAYAPSLEACSETADWMTKDDWTAGAGDIVLSGPALWLRKKFLHCPRCYAPGSSGPKPRCSSPAADTRRPRC